VGGRRTFHDVPVGEIPHMRESLGTEEKTSRSLSSLRYSPPPGAYAQIPLPIVDRAIDKTSRTGVILYETKLSCPSFNGYYHDSRNRNMSRFVPKPGLARKPGKLCHTYS